MVTDPKSLELEAEIARFERENPELANTLKMMGVTIEKYNEMLLNISAKGVITSNSTKA